MKNRLVGHNLTHCVGDKVHLLHEFKVNNAKAVNNYIHQKLKGLLVDINNEFFTCPYNLLKQALELIIDNDELYSDRINSIIDYVYSLKSLEYSPNDWIHNIEGTILQENHLVLTNVDLDIFNFKTSNNDQKMEYLKNCAQSFKNNLEAPNILIWKNFQVYLIDQLNIPKYLYKARTWRKIFNDYLQTLIVVE